MSQDNLNQQPQTSQQQYQISNNTQQSLQQPQQQQHQAYASNVQQQQQQQQQQQTLPNYQQQYPIINSQQSNNVHTSNLLNNNISNSQSTNMSSNPQQQLQSQAPQQQQQQQQHQQPQLQPQQPQQQQDQQPQFNNSNQQLHISTSTATAIAATTVVTQNSQPVNKNNVNSKVDDKELNESSDGDETEEENEIVEESPDGRWLKRNELVAQRDVPAIDQAFLAMDTENGFEVVWNEIHFNSRRNSKIVKLQSRQNSQTSGVLANDASSSSNADKSTDKDGNSSTKVVDQAFRNLIGLNHPNIVKFHNYWTDNKYKNQQLRIVFITEYVSSGSLKQFLRKAKKTNQPIKKQTWKRWCIQLLTALQYLHNCEPPIIHGNLSCDTIFIQHNGVIKIGSIAPDDLNNHVKTCLDISNFSKNIHFLAPERLQFLTNESTSPTTPAADIYSFGIVALEMFNLELGGNGDTHACTPELINSSIEALDDKRQRDFISMCLQSDPSKRPTAKELLFHPLLFEVPSLRLLAAHKFIEQPIESRDANFDDSYFMRPGDSILATCSICPEPLKYSSLPQFEANKYLEDVKNGIYPLTAYTSTYDRKLVQVSSFKASPSEKSQTVVTTQTMTTTTANSVKNAGACSESSSTLSATTTANTTATTLSSTSSSSSTSPSQSLSQVITQQFQQQQKIQQLAASAAKMMEPKTSSTPPPSLADSMNLLNSNSDPNNIQSQVPVLANSAYMMQSLQQQNGQELEQIDQSGESNDHSRSTKSTSPQPLQSQQSFHHNDRSSSSVSPTTLTGQAQAIQNGNMPSSFYDYQQHQQQQQQNQQLRTQSPSSTPNDQTITNVTNNGNDFTYVNYEKRHAQKLELNITFPDDKYHNIFTLALQITFDDKTARYIESQIRRSEPAINLAEELISYGLVSELDRENLYSSLCQALKKADLNSGISDSNSTSVDLHGNMNANKEMKRTLITHTFTSEE